mgnify:CR=1 FL=1
MLLDPAWQGVEDPIDLVVGLRVSEESETEGLDIAEHGEAAYNA